MSLIYTKYAPETYPSVVKSGRVTTFIDEPGYFQGDADDKHLARAWWAVCNCREEPDECDKELIKLCWAKEFTQRFQELDMVPPAWFTALIT